jgi:hypothetical protein
MIQKALMGVATCATAIAFAGCGGDDNKALSYSAFTEKANEICKSSDADIEATSNKLTGKAATDAPIYDELIPKIEDASDKLKDLDPPDELKEAHDNFNAVLDKQIQGAKDAQEAAKTGDDAAYVAKVKELEPISKEGDEAASKLGAADCVD